MLVTRVRPELITFMSSPPSDARRASAIGKALRQTLEWLQDKGATPQVLRADGEASTEFRAACRSHGLRPRTDLSDILDSPGTTIPGAVALHAITSSGESRSPALRTPL